MKDFNWPVNTFGLDKMVGDNNKTEKKISGFSKLSKRGKIKWLVENFFIDPEGAMKEIMSYWHSNEKQQKILDGFSENTISNFPMPFGVAPNFVINDHTYCVPMVIEESSVVAAASAAAKYWMTRGGFRTEILGTRKIGQVHFKWKGELNKLQEYKDDIEAYLRKESDDITRNMVKRGGGIAEMKFIHIPEIADDYYQLKVEFETCDSMGANFINSCLEQFAKSLEEFLVDHDSFSDDERDIEIIMCILSNYTPNCLVRAMVSCPISALGEFDEGVTAEEFAKKFKTAIDIAIHDPYRATTHNKGIFNGVDAVVLATGNDFRATEACGHTWASRDGQYRSLSRCSINNDTFKFWIDLPIAIGTVGGLTSLHPMAKTSLELLGNPSANKLMEIIAATGLAQNFAAVRSLITTGIQKGHMKMHLQNILNHFKADDAEMSTAIAHFESEAISFNAVRVFLERSRGIAVE